MFPPQFTTAPGLFHSPAIYASSVDVWGQKMVSSSIRVNPLTSFYSSFLHFEEHLLFSVGGSLLFLRYHPQVSWVFFIICPIKKFQSQISTMGKTLLVGVYFYSSH